MCGIAGAVRAIGDGKQAASRAASPRLRELVETMSHAVRHRGPDGSGFWQSDAQEVVFGHRRLAIIDLSEGGAQPKIDPRSGCAITFNGEIYNYLELRAELEALGYAFRSSSDTEVILCAYDRWGVDAIARFRGIFALALWDPGRRQVHLVRDPMGIKPLYWTLVREEETGEEVLLFASEVRALLATGRVPRRLDAAGVASYLWHGFVVGPGTIVEGVQLLPAASVLTLAADPGDPRRNRRAESRYWSLPASAPPQTLAEVREELARTVRMQLIADVPLGVFLSGGVDSSSMAAMASEVMPDAVHTFTIGFDVPAYDESRYAQQVAESIRSRHTCTLLTEQTFQDQLDAAFTAIDQPTFDGINTYFVSRAAREAGMTVALAGTGGDELFGGYPSFVDIPKAARLGGFLPLGEEGAFVRRAFDRSVGWGAHLASGVAWNVLGVAPPQTRWGKIADVARAAHDPLGLYQVSYALFTRDTQDALAADGVRVAQRSQQYGLPAEIAGAWRRSIDGAELRHAVSMLELNSFIGERLLRDTDTASMAVALEVRVPLLDHVFATSVAGIDPERRFNPPRKKQVLREIALSRLDPAIFDRPKSGFVLPIDTWARQRLQPQMEALFADETLSRRAGLQGPVVRTLWRSFVDGRPGQYWSRAWALYVLLSWCRTHDVFLA
jgi:asparagine synthase (glutamine-hydrolysing)